MSRNKPNRHSPLDFAISMNDKSTLDMVKRAVEGGNTLLAYQPVVGSTSGTVAFYEGLIRVLDQKGRIIPAKDFMPIVEDTSLGRDLDCCALKHGLRALRETPDLRLSINMSARSIGYKPWMQILDRALAQDYTIGERLILEITENSAMTLPELVVNFMQRLQKHGICFALDDFGAGYTAVRYFKDFYFDIVKLDHTFIHKIADDPDNEVLTRALASIAEQFDMLTVAEGVERAEDVALLAKIGIDCLQGFYFSAPTTQPPFAKQQDRRAIA